MTSKDGDVPTLNKTLFRTLWCSQLIYKQYVEICLNCFNYSYHFIYMFGVAVIIFAEVICLLTTYNRVKVDLHDPAVGSCYDKETPVK